MHAPETLLEILEGLDGAATVEEVVPGFPVIKIKTPQATAEIALHGAQVLGWQPEGAEPVLFTSLKAVFEEGTAIRGGIPICWPWFGAHPDDASMPSHGFARTRFWELTSAGMEGQDAVLVFKLPVTDETRAMFPHEFELTATIQVGMQLGVALKTRNLGEKSFRIGGALHTYFRVGDITRTQVDGVKGATFVDMLAGPDEQEMTEQLKIDGEIDVIYQSMSSLLLRDLSMHRAIFVDKFGSRSTVVWNPWKEKSKELKDLPNNAYKEFVCVEVANAGKDRPTVRPNMSHTLRATIGMRPLA
ncbi:MAG: D-hexose-6-phosphate mutarotase [Akkermansiaceae bacterium]|nr:D-hexose-6-phosphate mutarotase [Akkermansiaceae bacterium]NNM27979.1 D-hexose-6-phosphate mutarotase [Akkermansiaceae bacterium]